MDETRLLQVFAHFLSTATILSCLLLKVPQILNIKKKQSAKGVYVQAIVMEVVGFTIMTLYNFTNNYGVMTYLEYPIILCQIYVLIYYTLKYKRMLTLPIVPFVAGAYVVTVLGFMLEFIPKHLLGYLVPFCTPLSGFAKVTYIYGIVAAANADSVSLLTWIISIATNAARIFTVYVDSGDMKLMLNFFISSMLSGGVLGTAFYYQNIAPSYPPPTRRKSPRFRSHLD